MGKNHKTTRASQKALEDFRDMCAAEVQPDGSVGRPCWLDGQPIDYEAAQTDYKNPDRFQRDHKKPVDTHPELADDPANWEASHADCNRRKSNGEARPPIGSLSRAWT